jgi:hypothetical protein
MTVLTEETVQKLLDEGKSLAHVGRIHGVSLSAVRYWLSMHPNVVVYKSKWMTPLYSNLAIDALKSSSCLAEALKKLGLKVKPGNYETIYRLSGKQGLDLKTIFSDNKKNSICQKNLRDRKDQSTYFIEDSTVDRGSIKRYILEHNLIPYACHLCGNPGKWLDKELVLILDHINGVNNDNRLENLRFCCPNCNSQLPTHCGSNKRRTGKKLCRECGKEFIPHTEGSIGTVCSSCVKPRSVVVPETFCEDVLTLLKRGESYKGIGKIYGISANAIKKRMRHRGVNPPSRSGKKLKKNNLTRI